MQHHAFVLYGSFEWATTRIDADDLKQSPDTHTFHFERMNIADAQSIVKMAETKAIVRPHRTFIIDAHEILLEAQNSLLKLIEDPATRVRFYFIIPHPAMLLPTVTSRLHVLDTEYQNQSSALFRLFLKESYADRLDHIARELKQDDSTWVKALFESLGAYAKEEHDPHYLRLTIDVTQYLQNPGSSKKMLLEYIALV